ncbi:MAG TPA: hypothetical protein VIC07_00380 [Acidimicrobiia bacterium]|jgi:hypothetical protein
MPGTNGGEPAQSTHDRIELVATVVMAAAAILTAWAAFQSAKWSGIQAIEFSRASAARVESTRLDDRAGQLAAIDVDVYLSWLEAVSREIEQGTNAIDSDAGYQPVEGTLSAFFYDRMRDEFRPAFDAWLQSRPLLNPEAPKTPFQMEAYVLADAVEADRLLDEAGEHTEAALTANQNSDNHVLTAVALALSLFFAGVSSKLGDWSNRLIAIVLSTVIFLGAATVLILLPKVAPFG